MRHRRSPVALVALALAAGGCGGSQPADVVRDHFEAIVARDGGRACSRLSDELRRDIERAPAARRAGRSCADVMELAAGLNPSLAKREVEELEIEVDENGDRAAATFRNPLVRREETISLARQGDDWKIASLETRPRS